MPRDASDLVGEFHDWITQETLAQAIVNGDELKLVSINDAGLLSRAKGETELSDVPELVAATPPYLPEPRPKRRTRSRDLLPNALPLSGGGPSRSRRARRRRLSEGDDRGVCNGDHGPHGVYVWYTSTLAYPAVGGFRR